MGLRNALILLLLVYTDYPSFAGASSCKAGCMGQSKNVLKLQEGTTYVYNLEGNTVTSVPKTSGANGETTTLNLRAKVEVNVQPNCAALIKLKSVQITGPSDKKYGSLAQLEANPLRVSLNGGALSSDVCAVPEDDYTSLNIKRAVASLLQLSSDESTTLLKEVDVFGACPTDYSVNKEGDTTIVRKVRDLNRCAYRESIRQDIFSIPNAGSSILQATPLLEPTFSAEIRIKGGVVETATVRENYLFRPFSDKGNGANTKVTTKLSLESKSAGSIPDTTSESRSIIFENPHEGVTTSIQTVLAALHKAVDSGDKYAELLAARNFAELVSIVRRASAEDLLSVYGQVKAGAGFKNKELAKRILRNALSESGSGDSVAVAIELLKNKELSHPELWYQSFAFARHVSLATLDKAASILNDQSVPNSGYLGIGALVGIYCREHNCENVPQVNNLLSKLAAPLANTVPADRNAENELIGRLKALRNAKTLNEDAINKVIGVLKDTKTTNRVRSAALDTAISDACDEVIRKAAADVLNDREEDSELRIKAYLVLAECPTTQSANKLSEFLDTEPSNQVGAFITSHLRNLRASANPDRQAARAVLQNVKPKNRYPIDIRKYSQNLEASYDIDALGSSASAEANVIYSQKSYLPRSANLNLTAEVFGHNFNLFEVTGRAENLERVVERIFGPKGYLRTNKPIDIYKRVIREIKEIKEYASKKSNIVSRNRRSPNLNDLRGFYSKFQKDNSELDDETHIDIALRLFSNEIFWVALDESNLSSPKNVIDKVTGFIESEVGRGRNIKKNIQNHKIFLDAELAYPTAAGLPVKLTAVGSSVVNLKIGGDLDFNALLKDPKNGQVKVEVRPSASIEVIGKLTVDGYAVEAGVKLATTLHTATGTDVTVKLLDGQGIDLNIGLPLKDSDILTASTEVLTTVRERGQVQTTGALKFQIPRKDYSGAFDQLQPLIGLTVHAAVGFPNDPNALTSGAALYPLNGNSKVSLRLEKEDDNLKSYHFRFQFNVADPTHRRIEALIETPGSSVPRELSFLAEAKTVPNKEINIKINSPLYNFLTQVKVTDTDSEYSLSGLAEVQDVFSYKARLGALISGSTYTPILEVTNADGSKANIVDIEGTVTVDKSGPANRKFTFNNVRVSNSKGKFSVDGTIAKDTNLFETDLKIGYDQGTVGIKSKFQRQGENNLKVVAEVVPSQFADFGFGIKYEFQREKTFFENSLAVTHGKDLNSADSRLSIFNRVTYEVQSVSQFDFSTKNTITYPLFAVSGNFEGHATQKSLSYDLALAYEQTSVSSKLTAKTGITKPGDFEINFAAKALSHGVQVELKRDIIAPNKSKFTNSLVITPGGRYSLDAEVTHQLDNNNIDARLLLVAKLEGVNDPYKLDVGAIANPTTLEAHSKLSAGGNDLLDAELKQKRSAPQSGSFKLNLRKAFESNGDYKRTADKASAKFIINFLPISRKIKGVADLTVTGSKHVGTIEVLYDADKDPSRKLLIQTDTDLSTRSIKSKNKIEESGREVLLNFNGESTGKLGNGGVSGGYDLTLPCGLQLVARGKQVLNVLPSNSNGELFLELGYSPAKGTPLTKLTLETSAKNVDPKRLSFETKSSIKYSCESGDAFLTQSISSVPQDGKLHLDIQNAFGGSHLGEYQYNGKAKLVVDQKKVKYDFSASLADKYAADGVGNIQLPGEDRTFHWDETVNIKSPVESFRNVKSVSLVHLVKGEGNSPYQLKLSQEVVINDKTYLIKAEGQGTKRDGSLKFSHAQTGLEELNGALSFNHNHDNDLENYEGTLDLSRGAKALNLNLKVDHNKAGNLINTRLSGTTPFESAKKLDIALALKNLGYKNGNAELKALVNDESLELASKLNFESGQYLIDIGGQLNGKKIRFFSRVDKKSDRSYQQELQTAWPHNGGGQFDLTVSSDFDNLESFQIVAKANSQKLSIDKLKIEVGNKATKSGQAKRVNFNAQNAQGKIFSGSATYAVKEDETGFSVEGKGQVNIKGENHPLTYKYAQWRLKGEEYGYSRTVNVDLVKASYVLENKLTNKVHILTQKYCWDSKCNEFDFNFKRQDEVNPKTELSLKIDSNIFGPPYDQKLSLISGTRRDGVFADHETVLTLRGTKYTFNSYVKKDKAGAVLVVPTREITAIAVYELPNLRSTNLKAKIDASLALDSKNNPKDVARLVAEASAEDVQRTLVAKAGVKISHPAIRELSLKVESTVAPLHGKGSVDVDVFAKKGQRMVLSYEYDLQEVPSGRNFSTKASINSKGLSLDIGGAGHILGSKGGFSAATFFYFVDDKNVKKEVGFLVTTTPTQATALVKVPGHTLVDGDFKITSNDNIRTVEGELTLAEGETAVLKTEARALESVQFTLSPKSNPNRKLIGLISINSEKFEVRADRVENGKENLFFILATIDQTDLLKLDYDFQAENIKKSLQYFEKLGQDVLTRLRAIVENLTNDLKVEIKNLAEAFKKAQPNLKPLLEKYQATFKAIRAEIENDENFKALSGFTKRIVGGVIEATEAYVKFVIEVYDILSKNIEETQVQLVELYEKITPDVIKLVKKIVQLYTDVAATSLKLFGQLAQQILDIVKEHEKDIKLVIRNILESFQDIGRVVIQNIRQFRHEIEDITTLLIDQVKSLPIVENFKERIQELTDFEIPPYFWEQYNELKFAITENLPYPELVELVESIFNYVEKRLKREPVDDVKELTAISQQAVKAGNVLVEAVKGYYNTQDVPVLGYSLPLPLSLPATAVLKLPELGNIRFSPLNLLSFVADLPTPLQLFYSYRPTINPIDSIPPYKAYGLIVDSHHLFTFDKKHISLEGTCSYILAQDIEDGNFTIVANLENGKITSLTVADKTDSADILPDNKVTLNGKTSDFPVSSNELSGWRRYNSVNVALKSGVFVTKLVDKDIYIIRVSGFYFARTRGLLGTITNEQYDEATLPNGHIAKSTSELAAAYQLSNCPALSGHQHEHAHVPECTALFTSDSPLRVYFHLLPPKEYREACDVHAHMSPDNAQKAACAIAAAYVLALREEEHILPSIPPQCAQCTINGKALQLGESEEVSTGDKADVVLVIEQTSYNSAVFKDLVTPLITSLTADLKEKGLGDVQFALIGYGGPNQKWPAHYGNNGKITYEGNSDAINFGDNEVFTPEDEFVRRLVVVKKIIDSELGLEPVVQAMNEANKYPFRVGSSKIIILVNSQPCVSSKLFPYSLQVPRTMGIYGLYKLQGFNFFLITPLKSIKLQKTDGKTKGIVGVDKEKVYYLSDAKKKPVEGVADDRSGLVLPSDDLCLAFSQFYGGAAFSSQNLLDAKPEAKKKFVQVVAQRIAQGAAKNSFNEDCTCSLKKGVLPVAQCSVSSRREGSR